MNRPFTRCYHDIFETDLDLLPNATAIHCAVLFAIARLTIGWQKPEGDHISFGQIATFSRASSRSVRRAVKDLHTAGVIHFSCRVGAVPFMGIVSAAREDKVPIQAEISASTTPATQDRVPRPHRPHFQQTPATQADSKESLKDNLKKERGVEATDNARAANREKTASQNDNVFGKILRFPLSFLEIESENQEKVDA